MTDYGTRARDSAERQLELRLKKTYTQAQKDILKKLDAYTAKFKAQDKEMRLQLDEGSITQDEYQNWVNRRVFVGAQWDTKVKDITDTLTELRASDLDQIFESELGVFAKNANYQAYCLEHGIGKDFGFDLYDEDAVRNLVEKKPALLPKKVVNPQKHNHWNQGIISNAITQGIIQGEPIPKIAARIANDTANHNMKASTMYARTAMTCAQNAGRMEMLRQSKEMGIDVMKKWMSTHDSRTRDSHIRLDGQIAEVEKPFKSIFGKIMFPGDPQADPADVYNCRCTLVYVYPGYDDLSEYENSQKAKEESFEEWTKRKESEEYDEEKAMEDYDRIWGDMIDERSLSEYEDSLTAEQKAELEKLLKKNEYGMSPERYWNMLSDGVTVDDDVNEFIEKAELNKNLLGSLKEEKEEYYDSPIKEKWTGSKYEKQHIDIEKATSTEEVEEALSKAGVFSSGKKTRLAGMDIANAKEVAHSTVEMTEEYPWMKRKISYLQGKKLDDNVLAVFTTESSYKGKTYYIAVNKKNMATRHEANIIKASGMYHPVGTGSIASDIEHEWGHGIVAVLSDKMGVPADDVAKMITDRALASAGLSRNVETIKYNLSGYATVDDHEFISEAISEFYSAGVPRKLAKSVVEAVKYYAKGAGLK